ncbi:MAG: hypothetical protein WDN24_06775 [Sphingomonas sp.]
MRGVPGGAAPESGFAALRLGWDEFRTFLMIVVISIAASFLAAIVFLLLFLVSMVVFFVTRDMPLVAVLLCGVIWISALCATLYAGCGSRWSSRSRSSAAADRRRGLGDHARPLLDAAAALSRDLRDHDDPVIAVFIPFAWVLLGSLFAILRPAAGRSRRASWA